VLPPHGLSQVNRVAHRFPPPLLPNAAKTVSATTFAAAMPDPMLERRLRCAASAGKATGAPLASRRSCLGAPPELERLAFFASGSAGGADAGLLPRGSESTAGTSGRKRPGEGGRFAAEAGTGDGMRFGVGEGVRFAAAGVAGEGARFAAAGGAGEERRFAAGLGAGEGARFAAAALGAGEGARCAAAGDGEDRRLAPDFGAGEGAHFADGVAPVDDARCLGFGPGLFFGFGPGLLGALVGVAPGELPRAFFCGGSECSFRASFEPTRLDAPNSHVGKPKFSFQHIAATWNARSSVVSGVLLLRRYRFMAGDPLAERPLADFVFVADGGTDAGRPPLLEDAPTEPTGDLLL